MKCDLMTKNSQLVRMHDLIPDLRSVSRASLAHVEEAILVRWRAKPSRENVGDW